MWCAQPAAALTYTVDSTADTGGACAVVPTSCTLRQALLAAAGNSGPDAIHFSFAGTQTPAAPAVISPASAPPNGGGDEQLSGVGTSEPDYGASPVIEIDGSRAGGGTCLTISTAPSTFSTIQGL